MKNKIGLTLLMVAIWATGLGIIIKSLGWLVAIGIFFCFWANNLEKKIDGN